MSDRKVGIGWFLILAIVSGFFAVLHLRPYDESFWFYFAMTWASMFVVVLIVKAKPEPPTGATDAP